MGLFDNFAGMAGNPQVAELAAKVGIGPEQVEQVLAILPEAAAAPGDTAENAANASGISLETVQELIRHMGGGDNPLDALGGLFGS